MKKKTYIEPSVQVLKVKIEKGFAGSKDNDCSEVGEAGTLSEGDTYTW